MQLICTCDGAARGNPGPAAVGVVICDERGLRLAKRSRYLGTATNNQAEWRALRLTLYEAGVIAKRRGGPAEASLLIQMDSELVVRQWSGEYRVKCPGLGILRHQCQGAARQFKRVDVIHIPRELNREADALANRPLDERERMMADG